MKDFPNFMNNLRTKKKFTKGSVICLGLFYICLLAAVQSTHIFAQSGRKPVVPVQQPDTNIEPAAPTQISNNNSFQEDEEYRYIAPTDVERFIRELNKAGGRGYKLEHITPVVRERQSSIEKQLATMNLTSVIRKDSIYKYEYKWFLAEETPDLELRLNTLANEGFCFCKQISLVAEPNPTEDELKSNPYMLTHLANIIFVELVNGKKEKCEYKVIGSSLSLFVNASKKIEEILNEAIKEGFYPIALLHTRSFISEIGVILKKEEKSNETNNTNINPILLNTNKDGGTNLSNKNLDYQLILSTWRSLKKQIEKLGKQGYRIAIVNAYVALMYKDNSAAMPISYKRAKVFNSEEWSKLLDQGWIYRTVGYSSYLYEKDLLYFEKPLAKVHKEYQMVLLTDDFSEFQKDRIERNAPSKYKKYENSKSAFKRLSKEGYTICDLVYIREGYIEVRDLVYVHIPTLIFERLRQ